MDASRCSKSLKLQGMEEKRALDDAAVGDNIEMVHRLHVFMQ